MAALYVKRPLFGELEMSGRIQDDPRRQAFAAKKDAPRRWAAIVQAPFTNLSCTEFQAQAATWMLIKRAAVANNFAKSQIVRDAVKRMISDIEAWATNEKCRYIIFNYTGNRGVAVLMVDGYERPGFATLRYVLSDGSIPGIGKCLIEEAVNVSAKAGKEGKVCLIAESAYLERLYEVYGFITDEPASMMSGAIMTFNPKGQRTATKWFYTGQRWYFCPIG
jgi:hypothetical protein